MLSFDQWFLIAYTAYTVGGRHGAAMGRER